MLPMLTGFAIIILRGLIPLIRQRSGRGVPAFFLLLGPALNFAERHTLASRAGAKFQIKVLMIFCIRI